MCPVVETQLAETQFAESEVQFAEFFRQTGQSRDNLPNSANWVSATIPNSGVYAQFAETQLAETQFAESEVQFAEFFSTNWVK